MAKAQWTPTGIYRHVEFRMLAETQSTRRMSYRCTACGRRQTYLEWRKWPEWVHQWCRGHEHVGDQLKLRWRRRLP